MKQDMHYYGTYCLARMAGLTPEAARIIAYAAQYVDDSTKLVIKNRTTGGKLVAEETAHHAYQVKNLDKKHQRYIWVPFHFLPGGQGNTFYEKVVCVKGTQNPLADKMLDHCLAGVEREFGLHLVGITSHVYEDTFSHQGFSGLASPRNRFKDDSLEALNANPATTEYLRSKERNFLEKFWEGIKSSELYIELAETVGGGLAENLSGALGHAAALTYPDLPYLRWEFEYEHPLFGKNEYRRQNNQEFLEGCQAMHSFFQLVAKANPVWADQSCMVEWDDKLDSGISDLLLRQEGTQERAATWQDGFSNGKLHPSVKGEQIPAYDRAEWEGQRDAFTTMDSIREACQSDVYRFYQAASLHRHYVLRELLPAHGIVVV
jgi:uncharacterized protein DUF6765